MVEQIQELIDKIKKDGIEDADKRAGEIESEAKKHAETIINDAKKEAQRIAEDAKQDGKKFHDSTVKSLENASRDMLLSLKSQIESMLGNIVKAEINNTLDKDAMIRIILDIAKLHFEENGKNSDIKVALNAENLKDVEAAVLKNLQQEFKKSVSFEPREDIVTGFTVSYDKGKSCFDFTDESLVAFLGAYLNDNVSSILQNSINK